MLSPQALIKGVVSRILPAPYQDGPEAERTVRLGRYGSQYAIIEAFKSHVLADEGTYFTANNGATGIATVAAPTAFSPTVPLFSVFNSDSISNTNSKRIYLDYLRIVQTAAGTGGTGVQLLVTLDTGNRYASGGTDLAPTSPNMDSPQRNAVAVVKFLPTTSVATTNVRTTSGIIALATAMTAPLPINASLACNFGSIETMAGGIMSVTQVIMTVGASPVIIGPGQSCVIQYLITAQSAASSWAPEISWWEK